VYICEQMTGIEGKDGLTLEAGGTQAFVLQCRLVYRRDPTRSRVQYMSFEGSYVKSRSCFESRLFRMTN
jgi:hypothetical protein